MNLMMDSKPGSEPACKSIYILAIKLWAYNRQGTHVHAVELVLQMLLSYNYCTHEDKRITDWKEHRK